MKKLKETAVSVVLLLALSLLPGCNTYRYGTQDVQSGYENPSWAPPYSYGTRYYYLPDIECYYDIYSREFIFLDRAQWMYSQDIPYIYRNFNLNNCFIVIVNSNIYQPWMHHQYYVSHFPRYYYRDYYDHSNFPYVRGYNENNRRAIYWGENERDRARSWDNENLNNNRQFRYSREDRLYYNNTYNQTDRKQIPDNRVGRENQMNNPGNNTNRPENQGNNPENRRTGNENNNTVQPSGNNNLPGQQPSNSPEIRRPRETNYYGKPIGQPVKVERQMREKSESGSSDNNSRNRESNSRSNSGRR